MVAGDRLSSTIRTLPTSPGSTLSALPRVGRSVEPERPQSAPLTMELAGPSAQQSAPRRPPSPYKMRQTDQSRQRSQQHVQAPMQPFSPAEAADYHAGPFIGGTQKAKWAFLGPERHPIDPSSQIIWPAAQHAVGDFLPPALRRPSPLAQQPLRTGRRPPLRTAEEAAPARRAALAASLLSRQLNGGAVGRKAKQWEEIADTHRHGGSQQRPSSARPALTKPPSASASGRRRPTSARGASRPPSISIDDPYGIDDVRPKYGEATFPRPPAPAYESTGDAAIDELVAAAGSRAQLIAMRDKLDKLEAEIEANHAQRLSARARALMPPTQRPPTPSLPEPPPPATPMRASWRHRPLSAPRGAMTVDSAPRCPDTVEISARSAPRNPATALVPAGAGQYSDSHPQSLADGLRDSAAFAQQRWAADATVMRTVASGVPTLATELNAEVQRLEHGAALMEVAARTNAALHGEATWPPAPYDGEEPDSAYAELAEASMEAMLLEGGALPPTIDEGGMGRIDEVEPAPPPPATAAEPPAATEPTLPPPPAGIRFAWSHPQRLLAGLASGEFSWGAGEQEQLDDYVEQMLTFADPGRAEAVYGAGGREGAASGVDDETLLQLLQLPSEGDESSPASTRPRPSSGRARPLSTVRGGLPDDPDAPPPAWVNRLSLGPKEKEMRDLENRFAEHFGNSGGVARVGGGESAHLRAPAHRKAPSETAPPRLARERLVETFGEEQALAALTAHIMNDVEHGHVLSYERMQCLRALELTERVAEGKLLSREEMNTLDQVEEIWREEARQSLSVLRSKEVGYEANLLKDKYYQVRKKQKAVSAIDDLEEKVFREATAKHEEAMRMWRHCEKGRRDVAKWRATLKAEFEGAVASLQTQGLDPKQLIQRPDLMGSFIEKIDTAPKEAAEAAEAAKAKARAKALADATKAAPKRPSSPKEKRRPSGAAPPRFAYARSNAARAIGTEQPRTVAAQLIQRTVDANRVSRFGDRLMAKAEQQQAYETLKTAAEEAKATDALTPAPPTRPRSGTRRPVLLVNQRTTAQAAADKKEAEKKAAVRKAAIRVAQVALETEREQKATKFAKFAARRARWEAQRIVAVAVGKAVTWNEAQARKNRSVRLIEPDGDHGDDDLADIDESRKPTVLSPPVAASPPTVAPAVRRGSYRVKIGVVNGCTRCAVVGTRSLPLSKLAPSDSTLAAATSRRALDTAIDAASAPPADAPPLVAAFLEAAVEAVALIAPNAALAAAHAAQDQRDATRKATAPSLVSKAMENAGAVSGAPPAQAAALMASFLESAVAAAAAIAPAAVIAAATRAVDTQTAPDAPQTAPDIPQPAPNTLQPAPDTPPAPRELRHVCQISKGEDGRWGVKLLRSGRAVDQTPDTEEHYAEPSEESVAAEGPPEPPATVEAPIAASSEPMVTAAGASSLTPAPLDFEEEIIADYVLDNINEARQARAEETERFVAKLKDVAAASEELAASAARLAERSTAIVAGDATRRSETLAISAPPDAPSQAVVATIDPQHDGTVWVSLGGDASQQRSAPLAPTMARPRAVVATINPQHDGTVRVSFRER